MAHATVVCGFVTVKKYEMVSVSVQKRRYSTRYVYGLIDQGVTYRTLQPLQMCFLQHGKRKRRRGGCSGELHRAQGGRAESLN